MSSEHPTGTHSGTPDGVGTPEYSPARIAGGVAVVAVLLVVLTVGAVSLPALGVGGAGAWILTVALVRGQRRLVTAGTALVFGGLLLAGVTGASPLALLVGAVATVVAYDAAHYAVRLGHQLGRSAPTGRAEIVHVGVTAAVALGAAAVGYLVFELGTGEQPATALVALLLAAVFLAWGLLRARD